jgi:hypothetical protein
VVSCGAVAAAPVGVSVTVSGLRGSGRTVIVAVSVASATSAAGVEAVTPAHTALIVIVAPGVATPATVNCWALLPLVATTPVSTISDSCGIGVGSEM